jgi:ABC-2 type transport system permease protein
MFFSLLKTQLNMNFGISSMLYKLKKEPSKKWAALAIGLCIVFGMGSIVAMYCFMVYAIFRASLALGKPELVLIMSFLLGQLIILFLGLFYIMSSFYFSRDIEVLVPLPLKPSHIIGSKFVVIMLNEYITLLPVLLPPIIIYGAGMGADALYWVKAILLLAASPVIPLAVCSLFVMGLMRIVNIGKKRDLLAIIGGMAGLIVAVGINLVFQRLPKGNELEFFKELIEDRYILIELIGRRFPPSLWATWGLSLPGIEGMRFFLLFMLVAGILFAGLLWLANRLFYGSILSGKQAGRKRKVIDISRSDGKLTNVSSPLRALFVKEWKIMLRTPVYMLNGIAGSLIGPVILLMMLIVQRNNPDFEVISGFLENPENTVYIALAGLGVMLFVSAINSAVYATSISREGQGFWFSRMIPVRPGIQALSKLIQGVTVSMLGIAVVDVFMVVFSRTGLLRVVVISIIAIIATVPMAAVGIIIDMLKPKLDWTSEQQAMKQNMNAVLGMLVSMAITAPAVGIVLVLQFIGTPEWVTYAALLVLFSALGAGGVAALIKTAEYRYARIEV